MGTDPRSRPHRAGTRLVFLLVVASSVLGPPPPRIARATQRPPDRVPMGVAAPAPTRSGVLTPRAAAGFGNHRAVPVKWLRGPTSPRPAPQPAMMPDQLASGGHVVAFRPEGVLIASGRHVLRAELVNAEPVPPVKEAPGPGVGSTGAIGREAYTYHHPWPGIDVTYESAPDGIVESTYHLAPGANVGLVRVRYNVPVRLDGGGALHWRFETGEVIESLPGAWQERNGERVRVDAAFRVLGDREVGVTLGAYDPAVPVVIDPVLRWHTFLGGTGNDHVVGIAADGTGKIYVTGSSDAPWGSPVNPFAGVVDAFVAALDAATGARLWHTFLGAPGSDQGVGIAVDGTGRVYVTGISYAPWGSPVNPFAGGPDAFVAVLDAATGARLWHTFLGSSSDEWGVGIAVDGTGKVCVTGRSYAPWGSPVSLHAGGWDAFVAALDAVTGTRLWHTFLGSSSDDYGAGIAADGTGKIHVTGSSNAAWGSAVDSFAGATDAFVAVLDAATGVRLWHTFLGSSTYDGGHAIAADGTGRVYVTGGSWADWGSPVNPFAGGVDAFVAALDAATGARLWHTFLGSSSSDEANGIAVDGTGKVHVTGYSDATWGSPVDPFAGDEDAVVAALDAATGARLWHTFFGSSRQDWGLGIAVDGTGKAYVTGSSWATWGTPVSPYLGARDAFVARLDTARAPWPARDFDGDAKSDPTVFRPSTGTWFEMRSSTGSGYGVSWGVNGDTPVPGDYDGDGITDAAVFRPSSGTWYVLQSTTGTGVGVPWGLTDDVPVPADYDGDGKTDIAVWRPSTGVWYIIRSSTNTAIAIGWGLTNDVPVPGDFDGDGKADPTVFRPSTGAWYELRSTTGAGFGAVWGQSGDVPLAGDYDGDGKADPTVFRASTGTWYELRSTTGVGYGVLWGTVNDMPIVGDYDGDGKDDPTVFRPSTNTWYQLRSTTGVGYGVVWGATGDLPQ